MKVIKARYEILSPIDATYIYKSIEAAGRTCYKSEEKITDESAEKFVRGIVKRGHEAMLEHTYLTVRFTVDRGVSHEIVRHRLASFAQESTRYCNYSQDKFGNEITVIEPCFFDDIPEEDRKTIRDYIESDTSIRLLDVNMTKEMHQYFNWYVGCHGCETSYFCMIDWGATPQEARDVLPNSLKTEVVMTANMREWRHFLKLRAAGTTGKPHPQMLEVAVPLLEELREKLPAIFEDIEPMKN